jgi:hypothetical protein
MKRKAWVLSALLATAMLVAAGIPGCTANKHSGGLVGNSYASQMIQIDDTTLRITTRKKVRGDLEEVNKPGTSMYNALITVQDGTTARAAIEAKNLGYDVYQVLSLRNYQVDGGNSMTQVQNKRNANADMGGGLSESSFTFAQGHYASDVELAIEVTIKLIPGKMPDTPPQDYVDVNEVLSRIGMTDMFPEKK